jgi:endonuclease/exonuclease/phosphatase family metal-dependent hydrolase
MLRRMRVVTWNMNAAFRSAEAQAKAWDYIRDVVGADIALVQEAIPPSPYQAVYRTMGDAKREWGSAVVALNPRYTLRSRNRRAVRETLGVGELYDSHPGAAAVADVVDTAGSVRFVAVSFYSEWEYLPPGSEKPDAPPAIYSTATCHRLVSDLTPLLVGSRRTVHRTPVLLAGDFNATTQVAAETTWQVEIDEARVLFDRLRVLGLHDVVAKTRDTRQRLDGCTCPAPETCSHVRTYRNRNRTDSRPTQLDYVFASEQLASNAKCTVFDREDAWALSDHCPLVIDVTDA